MSAYFQQADLTQSARDYPLGEAFKQWASTISQDELHALKETRFQRVLKRAWEVPFYQNLWTNHGLRREDVRGLDDLHHLPVFSKADLIASAERCPPYGDYHGLDSPQGRYRAVMQTTSGTTGAPQALFFGAKDREVQNRLLARAYLLQGLEAQDVVHSVYGFGMVNGGHYVREAILHYTESLLLPAGTGLETSSQNQIDLMRLFGATVLVGFGDYLARLAEVARAEGVLPGRELAVRMLSGHIAHDTRATLSRAWGNAQVFDWYGVGDTGIIAAESRPEGGLHIWEDAHHVEILDPVTHAAMPDGELGNICVTVLFKDTVYPIIRFNSHDLSARMTTKCDQFPALGRLVGFRGRSDEMVKLRGINVYPASVARVLAGAQAATGEFVCRVHRVASRDELTVDIEWRDTLPDESSAAALRASLRNALGVAVDVALLPPGATAAASGLEQRQKPRRLIDER